MVHGQLKAKKKKKKCQDQAESKEVESKIWHKIKGYLGKGFKEENQISLGLIPSYLTSRTNYLFFNFLKFTHF